MRRMMLQPRQNREFNFRAPRMLAREAQSGDSRTEAACACIAPMLDRLKAEVISLFQQLASLERRLRELITRVKGREVKLLGVVPTQFMFNARPHASSPALGRKKEAIEQRAISAAFQRRAFDTVQCPDHSQYPHCSCAVHGSNCVGYLSVEIPKIVF